MEHTPQNTGSNGGAAAPCKCGSRAGGCADGCRQAPRVFVGAQTVASMAAGLEVDDRTVRRLVRTGALRAYRIGRVLRILEEDANGFLGRVVVLRSPDAGGTRP